MHSRKAEVIEHPCTALLHAAEQVIAHIGESDEQDSRLLLDLAVAVDQLRRRITQPVDSYDR